MNDFELARRTRFVFGRNKENEAGHLIKYAGGSRVLLVTGQQSARVTGLTERIKRSLDRSGLEVRELTGVSSSPALDKVRQGIRMCRESGIDYVLAAGGGSVIDTAKVICAGVFYEGDAEELFTKKRIIVRSLPLGGVLTIPGSGAESSQEAVLTCQSESGRRLLSAGYSCFALDFVILNPELTFSLPPTLTAYGCADLLAHAAAYYFSPTPGTDLGDRLCEGLMQSVLNTMAELARDPKSYDARANLMWASAMAQDGMLTAGRVPDPAVQQLERTLCACCQLPLGSAVSVILPAWMTFAAQSCPERLAQFAVRVMGTPLSFDDLRFTAGQGIERLRSFFRLLGLPQRLTDVGADAARAAEIVNLLPFGPDGTIGTLVRLDRAACEAVYCIAANPEL